MFSIIGVLKTVVALVFPEGKHIFLKVICTIFLLAVQHLLLTIRDVTPLIVNTGSRRLAVSLICQLPVSTIRGDAKRIV
jgi:hypothetical protein